MTDELIQVQLRPLQLRDRDLLMAWLLDPDISRWWGNEASAIAAIRMAIDSPVAICRLIAASAGAAPIGYAQALEAGLLGGRAVNGLGPGTWDCALFIASRDHRGRGIGEAALTLLVEEVFSSTLAVACSIGVPIRNERTARAYEKSGFRWVSIADDPVLGPSWIMRRDRPTR